MDQGIREETIRENANKESVGSCDRYERRVCAKEREEVREFIMKKLRKGYIQLSKSPQMVPVLFVGKKDRKKRMVQDYRYLNKWTIKNNYPLPLILDVLENIGTKKVFMKIDLRWGI